MVSDDVKRSLDEITVKRINVVDEDGALRMAIASKERFPNPIIGGKEVITNRRPSAGIIFFNDDGDECGGLSFGNKHAEILFDRFEQDQVVGVTYKEDESGRRYGLTVWDRSERPVSELVDRLEQIKAMPEGVDRDSATERLHEDFRAPIRMFAGNNPDGSTAITFSDSMGRERIRIGVGVDDRPVIEVLGEDGQVEYRVPDTT